MAQIVGHVLESHSQDKQVAFHGSAERTRMAVVQPVAVDIEPMVPEQLGIWEANLLVVRRESQSEILPA